MGTLKGYGWTWTLQDAIPHKIFYTNERQEVLLVTLGSFLSVRPAYKFIKPKCDYSHAITQWYAEMMTNLMCISYP
jgi:hypothetical protein